MCSSNADTHADATVNDEVIMMSKMIDNTADDDGSDDEDGNHTDNN